MGLRIVMAPNEDGLGTSAWVVRIVKALWEQASASIGEIRVVVTSQRLADFHATKYGSAPVNITRLEGVTNAIELKKKPTGVVDVASTLQETVEHYLAYRRTYAEALERSRVLQGADLIIDLGVPPLIRAIAAQAGEKGRRRPAHLTVCDHAWGHTLAQMAAQQGLRNPQTAEALDCIRRDESLAHEVTVFPAPVTPPQLYSYWAEVLRIPRVNVLPGLLGGPRWSERWAGRPARDAVRRLLGIEDELPVLHISGGGTPVWDETLGELIADYIRRPPLYHVVVFNPAEARKAGAKMTVRRTAGGAIELGPHPRCERLKFLGSIIGETYHVLFAGFDVVLTRAGGATVNDAIAMRVPMVLVEERNHWQVERIREECLRMGLARAASLEEFSRRARALVETAQGELIMHAAARASMERIAREAEQWLVEHLLEVAARQRQ